MNEEQINIYDFAREVRDLLPSFLDVNLTSGPREDTWENFVKRLNLYLQSERV